MAYAIHEYYKNTFGGSLIPEPLFGRCINLSSRYIDRFTFARIVNPDEVPGLSDCACEMAEIIYRTKFYDSGREKKSETTDGYSVTYVTESVDGQASEEVLCRKLYEVCKLYLSSTGIMYCGVV